MLKFCFLISIDLTFQHWIFENSFSHKFSKHLMQKHTRTTFLLLIKKKNEHEVLVICARSKKNVFLKIWKKLREVKGYSWKLLVTRGSFLTQRVTTLLLPNIFNLVASCSTDYQVVFGLKINSGWLRLVFWIQRVVTLQCIM